ADAQVEHLDLAVTPVDANLVVLGRLVEELAPKDNALEVVALENDRCPDRRYILGDGERLRVRQAAPGVKDRDVGRALVGEQGGRDCGLELPGADEGRRQRQTVEQDRGLGREVAAVDRERQVAAALGGRGLAEAAQRRRERRATEPVRKLSLIQAARIDRVVAGFEEPVAGRGELRRAADGPVLGRRWLLHVHLVRRAIPKDHVGAGPAL